MKLLDFDNHTLESFINYKCNLPEKLKESFDFVVNKLGAQKVKKISKLKWNEGKNYDWAVLKNDSVVMLIRKYRTHFTVFSEFTASEKYKNNFSIFTYDTNEKLLSDEESDERCDNNYIDIDSSIDSMLKIIKEGHSHLLWNSSAVHIPKHVEIKIGIIDNSIHSFDLLVFATEELANIQTQLYAENEMWDMLKKLKVGDLVGKSKSKIKSISIDLEDNYYHGLGLYFEGDSFKDVYCLTMYYLNDILKLI